MEAERLRIRSRPVLTVGVAWAIVLLLATSAWADHAYIEISIPVDTVVRDVPMDTKIQLATAEVPDEFQDHSCEVRAHAENQHSIHHGNDLVVESGTSQVLLSDVEAQPGQVVEAKEPLELGDLITVSLIMGPDEVFSAGIDVVVECIPEEITTTTAATTTTAQVSPTEETTTTTAGTSTTEEPTSTTADVSDTSVSSTQPSSTSIADEVKGTEVLPFTGFEASEMGLIAVALLAAGVLVGVGARRTDD